jgi:hypothetical protein
MLQPEHQPDRYARLIGGIEHAAVLDRPAQAVAPYAQRLVDRDRVRRVLHGDMLGIPMHVILTDVPLGGWFMAIFLDVFHDDSSRRSAQRLTGLGVAAAVPTAVAGWAEWALSDDATKRVGVVHAAVNGVTTLVFAASWAARVRGHHASGVRLARVGAMTATVASALGGHMSSGRRAG